MISLSKGARISLAKESGNNQLTSVMAGLGWDEMRKPGFFGRIASCQETADLDTFAILLDQNDHLINGISDVVYFGNLTHNSGAVRHHGDNLTGDGDGDDEQITVDFVSLPSYVKKIVLGVNIYNAKQKKQDFGMIENAFIRLVDNSTNKEICRYNLTNDYAGKVAVIFGELYEHNGEWKFAAVGISPSKEAETISQIARLYV